jgi:hypothetical protein
MNWPVASLDPVRRLRVMAAALPGVALVERDLPEPLDTVWSFIGDLERSVPTFDRLVGSLRVVERDGEHLEVVARAPVLQLPTRFSVELRPGWCWMQSRMYIVGMAATAIDGGTRYAQLEGVPWRGTGVVRPLMRWLVNDDIEGIARWLRSQSKG